LSTEKSVNRALKPGDGFCHHRLARQPGDLRFAVRERTSYTPIACDQTITCTTLRATALPNLMMDGLGPVPRRCDMTNRRFESRTWVRGYR
jgi:hypothetical protein